MKTGARGGSWDCIQPSTFPTSTDPEESFHVLTRFYSFCSQAQDIPYRVPLFLTLALFSKRQDPWTLFAYCKAGRTPCSLQGRRGAKTPVNERAFQPPPSLPPPHHSQEHLGVRLAPPSRPPTWDSRIGSCPAPPSPHWVRGRGSKFPGLPFCSSFTKEEVQILQRQACAGTLACVCPIGRRMVPAQSPPAL